MLFPPGAQKVEFCAFATVAALEKLALHCTLGNSDCHYLVQGRSPIPGISSWRYLKVTERNKERKELRAKE
jgi:hypothetical protein